MSVDFKVIEYVELHTELNYHIPTQPTVAYINEVQNYNHGMETPVLPYDKSLVAIPHDRPNTFSAQSKVSIDANQSSLKVVAVTSAIHSGRADTPDPYGFWQAKSNIYFIVHFSLSTPGVVEIALTLNSTHEDGSHDIGELFQSQNKIFGFHRNGVLDNSFVSPISISLQPGSYVWRVVSNHNAEEGFLNGVKYDGVNSESIASSIVLSVTSQIALPNFSMESHTGLFWNLIESGGGFTFSFRTDNPFGLLLAPTSIDFYWESALTGQVLAFSRSLDSNDDAGVSLSSNGQHVVTVTQDDLLKFGVAHSDAFPSPPVPLEQSKPGELQLRATIDPDNVVAEINENDNIISSEVLPLAVVVVTHGFNPLKVNSEGFLKPFNDIAQGALAISNNNPILRNRVTTYVADWDSTSYFFSGFYDLLNSELYRAKGRLKQLEGDQITAADAFSYADHLLEAARSTASLSDEVLRKYAAKAYIELLFSTHYFGGNRNAPAPEVLLIGHSRGAGFNQYLAQALAVSGLNPHVIALDGYGADWEGSGGVLSEIEIGRGLNMPSDSTNYIAEKGLAFDPLVLKSVRFLFWPEKTIAEAQSNLIQLLKAPDRSSFGEGNLTIESTVHTDIYEKFLANPNYLSSTFLFGNSSGNSSEGEISDSSAADLLRVGFFDGDFSRLESYSRTIKRLRTLLADEPIMSDPDFVDSLDFARYLSDAWNANGKVGFVSTNAGNWLQLESGSSIGTDSVVPSGDAILRFKLSAVAVTPETEITVMLDDKPIATVAIKRTGLSQHSVVLEGLKLGVGKFTFQVTGQGSRISIGSLSFNPVENVPIVTDSSTIVNRMTDYGLTIIPPKIPSVELIKISNLHGGQLYLHDGKTLVQNDSFLRTADIAEGLRLLPFTDSYERGGFDCQAADSAGILIGGVSSVTVLVDNSSTWKNPTKATDVNRSGLVTPTDALLVINRLNEAGYNRYFQPLVSVPLICLDVNGDSYLSPSDALIVINELNSKSSAEAEGESIEIQVPGIVPSVTLRRKEKWGNNLEPSMVDLLFADSGMLLSI
ncbi:MAG: dockerin type I domain-containing protein [Pirellulales bacterium]